LIEFQYFWTYIEFPLQTVFIDAFIIPDVLSLFEQYID
jgi:hypothetical protein